MARNQRHSTTQGGSSDSVGAERSRAVAGVLSAFLIGIGIGLAYVGFSRRMVQIFDPTATTLRLIGFSICISLAAGPLAQRWLVRVALRRALHRWRHGEGELFGREEDTEDNLSLMKTAVGGLALVAGLGVAVLPLLQHIAAGVYHALTSSFLWPAGVLTTIELVLILACTLIPFSLLGWLVGAVHAVADAECRWNFRPAAAALFGAMVACGFSAWILDLNIPGGLYSVVGAIPLFLTAILATHRRSSRPVPVNVEPDWSGRMRVRELAGVRVSVFCTSVTLVAVILLWSRVFGIVGHMDRVDHRFLVAFLGVFPALGIWMAEWKRIGRVDSLSRYGIRSVVCGLLVALGPSMFGMLVPAGSLQDGWLCPVFVPILVLCAGFCLAGLGVALVDGWRIILDQAGSLRTTGGELIALSLAGAGLSLLLTPLLISWIGSYAVLVAMALVMLACGGVLITYDSAEEIFKRYRLLAGAVGIMVVLAFLLPIPARYWTRSERGVRLWLAEGQWLTRSGWDSVGTIEVCNEPVTPSPMDVHALDPVLMDSPLLFSDLLTMDRHVAILGNELHPSEALLLTEPRCVRRYAWDPSLVLEGAIGEVDEYSAFQFLRMNSSVLDVVVIDLRGVSSVQRDDILMADVIGRVYRHLAVDGFGVILIPLSDCSRKEVDGWRRTLQEYELPGGWTCIDSGGHRFLVWVFGSSGQWRDRWDRLAHAILRDASDWDRRFESPVHAEK